MQSESTILILLGLLFILSPATKGVCDRMGVPALIGYILLGLLLSVLDYQFEIMSPTSDAILAVLAEIGLVALLFKVGLKSNIHALIEKLPDASLIWIGDVLVNLAFGYTLARHLLDLPLQTSLVIGTAFSATSVAISVVVWDERGQLNSPKGQLLVDVAELDDLSGVILLAILLAVIPVLQDDGVNLLWIAGSTAFSVIIKLLLFITACYLFAHYLEADFTRFSNRWTGSPTTIEIAVLGAALAIAAFAGYLGFSLAIGALFAGLAFSRDAISISEGGKFDYFYDLFTPFFFIYIGLQVQPLALLTATDLGLMFFIVAAAGKLMGVTIPALRTLPRLDSLILGVSMIPRAEIALVIVYRCREIGEQVVSEEVFAAVVLTSLLTSISAPLLLRRLMSNTNSPS